MPWEALIACAMRERAVTRGEFDWTKNEVGKRITKTKRHRVTVS